MRNVAKPLLLIATCLFFCLESSPVLGIVRVHFDQDEYIVNGPGDTFTAQVLFDFDDSTLADDPHPAGLFSFGAATMFDSTKASVANVNSIVVPNALNNFGFLSPALRELGSGSAAAKGNVDQLANPLVTYSGTLLTTYTFTNLASAPDAYPLELDFFRTLGASEQIFVSGTGSVLDAGMTFTGARVVVVPEPSLAPLWCLGLIATITTRLIPFAWARIKG